MIDTDKDIIDEFFDDKYEGLTIDDWYKMNHHDWKDVVNEYNDLLAEVKRLREWEKRIRTYFGDEEMMDFYDWMKENMEE